MSAAERPLAQVPRWLWAALAATLALQIGWQAQRPRPAAAAADLPPAPRAAALRVAGFGEPAALARIAMLYVQAFDLGASGGAAYRHLDYARLSGWLGAILVTDPKSLYPLFAAARIYAEVDDPARSRAMLAFIHQAFVEDPDRRWPALAHAALLAKHRLKDLALARSYAADLQRLARDPAIPLWARQMEVFILEDMNELETAKVMLGGMLASGGLTDPAERRFLRQKLEELERRLASSP